MKIKPKNSDFPGNIKILTEINKMLASLLQTILMNSKGCLERQKTMENSFHSEGMEAKNKTPE